MADQSKRFKFPRRMRLSGVGQFAPVYGAKTRVTIGPLLIYSRPNDLAHARLGLAVPRSIGTAVKRNTIKRRLREAFRLMQHDWQNGYDVVITVRAHEPFELKQYQDALAEAAAVMHEIWTKRRRIRTSRE
jgi:ribonuclease P protein component